jgi:hypothetical protein
MSVITQLYVSILTKLALMGLQAGMIYDEHDPEGRINVVMHEAAHVSVSIHVTDGQYKMYVSYHHDCGDLICFEGTESIDLVLYQLGIVNASIDSTNRRLAA